MVQSKPKLKIARSERVELQDDGGISGSQGTVLEISKKKTPIVIKLIMNVSHDSLNLCNSI